MNLILFFKLKSDRSHMWGLKPRLKHIDKRGRTVFFDDRENAPAVSIHYRGFWNCYWPIRARISCVNIQNDANVKYKHIHPICLVYLNMMCYWQTNVINKKRIVPPKNRHISPFHIYSFQVCIIGMGNEQKKP